MHIRPYRPDDFDALYDICLRTGDSGADASSIYTDPRLLGHVYAGPYGRLQPDLAFILADDDDVPAGYVLGAADTRAFEQQCEQTWWPPLRQQYPLPVPPDWTGNDRDQQLVWLLHHPHTADARLLERFPAHLHIDILERGQGQGNGRRLIQTLLDALSARGVTGVHLGVGAANTRAIGFYQHVGFDTVVEQEWGRVMARTL